MIFAFRLKTSSGRLLRVFEQASQRLLRRCFTQTRVQCLHKTEICARLLMKFSSIFPCLCVSHAEIFIVAWVFWEIWWRRFESYVTAVWAENINFLLIQKIRVRFIVTWQNDTADVTHDAPFSEWERAIEEDEGEVLHNDFGKKFVTQQAEREKRCRQIGGPQSIVSRDWSDLKRLHQRVAWENKKKQLVN